MIYSIRHKKSISWTLLNDSTAISAKEMPNNNTDKELFAAASSRIQTGILTLLFPLKRRRPRPSPFISHRVLEAVASRILKSLLNLLPRRLLTICKKSSQRASNLDTRLKCIKEEIFFDLLYDSSSYFA